MTTQYVRELSNTRETTRKIYLVSISFLLGLTFAIALIPLPFGRKVYGALGQRERILSGASPLATRRAEQFGLGSPPPPVGDQANQTGAEKDEGGRFGDGG